MLATGWADAAGTAAAAQRWRSMQILERGQRSAAGWAGSCDAGKAAGSECGSGSVGDGDAAADVAAAVDGAAAASVGAAAGVGAGCSVLR